MSEPKSLDELKDKMMLELVVERNRYWRALTDIARWEKRQHPTWREIARKALSEPVE